MWLVALVLLPTFSALDYLAIRRLMSFLRITRKSSLLPFGFFFEIFFLIVAVFFIYFLDAICRLLPRVGAARLFSRVSWFVF